LSIKAAGAYAPRSTRHASGGTREIGGDDRSVVLGSRKIVEIGSLSRTISPCSSACTNAQIKSFRGAHKQAIVMVGWGNNVSTKGHAIAVGQALLFQPY
jgi:hypothetical protein